MQNYWDILECEENADLRTVKRAYAKKLKTIRQDENPKEFMELRAAYEEAQYQIQTQIYERELADVHPDENNDRSEQVLQEDTPPEPIDPPDAFLVLDNVQKLMKSPWGGSSVDGWKAILVDDRLEAIDEYLEFEHQLLGHLLSIHGFFDQDNVDYTCKKPIITRQVATLLYEHFGWNTSRRNADALDWLAKKLGVNKLSPVVPAWVEQEKVEILETDTPNTQMWIIVGVVIFVLLIMASMNENSQKRTYIDALKPFQHAGVAEVLFEDLCDKPQNIILYREDAKANTTIFFDSNHIFEKMREKNLIFLSISPDKAKSLYQTEVSILSVPSPEQCAEHKEKKKLERERSEELRNKVNEHRQQEL